MSDIVFGGIVGAIITFLIAWIVDSIPVWIAAKFFSDEDSFPRAMVATLGGIIVFAIVFAIFTIGLAVFIGPLASLVGVVIAFIALLLVFKAVFDVGWLGALGIAIMSVIIFLIIAFILSIIGIGIPNLIHHV
ncbi:hypothetical protein [Sulfuracidifex tepidarius]|uniref:Uncharacterized protein n=1 Tax=Sulfuracidifex tepidarius TaxID=1294262 RepID=A0A510DXJ5_9CREN|nr:hypothetical protein [Sulfuracidifex tepidarius]BBG24943.1 hypothetical protein IC006_2277 [Sulfuracidifex tepidarius]BBG27726.1 hypothetical protein IC007_2280 [Sulfuracidifex tepidarius]